MSCNVSLPWRYQCGSPSHPLRSLRPASFPSRRFFLSSDRPHHLSRSAILLIPAWLHASSLSPPGAPPTPIAPTTSLPDKIGSPPPSVITPLHVLEAGGPGNGRSAFGELIRARLEGKRRIGLALAGIERVRTGPVIAQHGLDMAGTVHNRDGNLISVLAALLDGPCRGLLGQLKRKLLFGQQRLRGGRSGHQNR